MPKLKLKFKLLAAFIAVWTIPVVWLLLFGQSLPVLLVIIFLLLLSLTLSIWLASGIVQPMEKMNLWSKYVGLGNFNYHLEVKSGNELEDLANSFNAMVSSLHDAFSRLEIDKDVISAERNKLAVTLSGITDAVISVDLKLNIVTFNQAAEKLTGFARDQVMGRSLSDLIKLFDKSHELTISEFCPIRTDKFEGIIFKGQGLRLLGLKGKESYVNLIASQIKEGFDVDLGCILTFHDVTEERLLEEMKMDFVTMAAHELRTPLTSIKDYLSVFIEEVSSVLKPEQGELISKVYTSAQNLSKLVEDLLNVSNIERGKITITPVLTDWSLVLKPVLESFKARAAEKNISLTLTLPPEPNPKVMVDKIKITEVLNNLLTNAVVYTESGGKINLSSYVEGNKLITSVADTGVGIPKKSLPHLFTKFYHVDTSLTQGKKGTGLGLYISKMIINLHHGEIWVKSELGKGSTFSFSLPLVI